MQSIEHAENTCVKNLRIEIATKAQRHKVSPRLENEKGISSNIYRGPDFRISGRPFFDLWTHSNVKGQIEIETHYYPGHPATSRTIRNQEIGSQINSQIGLLSGVGINIPVKENYLCIGMNSGYGFNNVVDQPNMRQILFGLSFIYQLKI